MYKSEGLLLKKKKSEFLHLELYDLQEDLVLLMSCVWKKGVIIVWDYPGNNVRGKLINAVPGQLFSEVISMTTTKGSPEWPGPRKLS